MRSASLWCCLVMAFTGCGGSSASTLCFLLSMPVASSFETPFFLQIERNGQYDPSVGLRYRLGEHGVLSGNAIGPLNEQGFRAQVIPTVEIEYVFGP